jgi:hypothetical protein
MAPVERLDRDDAGIDGVVVGLRGKMPVLIDLIGVGPTVETRLRAAADRHGLDAEALIAAANAALSAPSRTVTLDVATVLSL